MRSHYDTLAVSQQSSEEEIRKQYQRLALVYHPDKAGEDAKRQQEASRKFQKIVSAWEVLRDPNSRAEYDEALKMRRERAVGPVHDEVDLDDMEYVEETTPAEYLAELNLDTELVDANELGFEGPAAE
ncbi:Diphthamide biosynthesis protein 4 [Rhizophlyctis rosea]|uniref:Diphthamide biosynthesis protein 4 n=1 Tax=Rhizophlyctis rosea TaxID=64517 RepID=A0AAD5S7N8_9FUNG|nr:Diphthamide biosynthesis protein 4 [Rhizophlyctis rosea]